MLTIVIRAVERMHIQLDRYYFAAKWMWKVCMKVRWKMISSLHKVARCSGLFQLFVTCKVSWVLFAG